MRANASCDDRGLQLQLPRVRDVGEDVAAACRIASRLAPVRGRLLDERRCRVCGATPHLLDPHPHALAGNCAGDEDDLPLVASDHAPAGGGLLDQERQFIVS